MEPCLTLILTANDAIIKKLLLNDCKTEWSFCTFWVPPLIASHFPFGDVIMTLHKGEWICIFMDNFISVSENLKKKGHCWCVKQVFPGQSLDLELRPQLWLNFVAKMLFRMESWVWNALRKWSLERSERRGDKLACCFENRIFFNSLRFMHNRYSSSCLQMIWSNSCKVLYTHHVWQN